MLPAIVVLFNGTFVPASPPARLLFGHVMAPLAPIVSRLAERATLSGDDVRLERGSRICMFRIGTPAFRCNGVAATAPVTPFARGGDVYLPLAEVARALGGSVAYDARSASVAVTFARPSVVATPPPYDPSAPQVSPAAIFTPQPAAATPQAVAPAEPRPRRTAIPATPSRSPPYL